MDQVLAPEIRSFVSTIGRNELSQGTRFLKALYEGRLANRIADVWISMKYDAVERFYEIEDTTPSQWLHIFPDAEREYVLPKLRHLEAEIRQIESRVEKLLKISQTIEDGWFVRESIKAFHISPLMDLKREYQRLKRYFPQKTSSGFINRDHIDRAKQYSIVKLAEENMQGVKRCGKTHRTLCPFHQERTPSFYLYHDSNKFYCFGCQKHGDVIALAQKLLNIGFIEAVKYLAII